MGASSLPHFGIRYDRHGVVTYGVRVDGAGEFLGSNLSVDKLASVLAQVGEDATSMTDKLVTERQRSMMATVFGTDTHLRPLAAVALTERLEPAMRAAAYLDGDSMESELKQVLGNVETALDCGLADVLIVGTRGVIASGPLLSSSPIAAPMLCEWAAAKARDEFTEAMFTAVAGLGLRTRELQLEMAKYASQPQRVTGCLARVEGVHREAALLGTCLQLLLDGLAAGVVSARRTAAAASLHSELGRHLVAALKLSAINRAVNSRTQDCVQRLRVLTAEVVLVRREANHAIKALRTIKTAETGVLLHNAHAQLQLNGAATTSLWVLTALAAGLLGWRMLDRLAGRWSALGPAIGPAGSPSWGREGRVTLFYDLVLPLYINFLNFPLPLGTLLSAVLGLGLPWWLTHAVRLSVRSTGGRLAHVQTVRAGGEFKRMQEHLSTRPVSSVAVLSQSGQDGSLTKMGWSERNPSAWGGWERQVDVAMDMNIASRSIDRIALETTRPLGTPSSMLPTELYSLLQDELERAGAWSRRPRPVATPETIPYERTRVFRVCRVEGRWVEVAVVSSKLAILRDAIAHKFCYNPAQVRAQ